MVTDIRLQHLRSYKDDSFEFEPGVNIIVGPNASGKTNLLEAILVVCRGTSYRAKDAELVRFGEAWARIDAHTDGAERSVKFTVEPVPAKAYEIGGKTYKQLQLAHTLPAVLFEPNHLALLSGSPDLRRSYLDDLLEQTEPGFGMVRRAYRRTLSQRNALLKRGHHDITTQLFPWNVRLSELGGTIARQRSVLVERISASLPELYKNIAKSNDTVTIEYRTGFATASYETAMLGKLEASIAADQQRGFTAAGPHREDFEVQFNGRPAAEVASRGEIRTAILGLKITELAILESVRDHKPILLLDDVFSELDGKRRHALTDYLKNYQTFITTTDADIVTHHFTDQCAIIPLATPQKP